MRKLIFRQDREECIDTREEMLYVACGVGLEGDAGVGGCKVYEPPSRFVYLLQRLATVQDNVWQGPRNGLGAQIPSRPTRLVLIPSNKATITRKADISVTHGYLTCS